MGRKRHFAAEARREMRVLDEKDVRVRCINSMDHVSTRAYSELKLRAKILDPFSSLVWSRVAHLCGLEFL